MRNPRNHRLPEAFVRTGDRTSYTPTVTSTAKNVLEQALALPAGERRRVAEALLDAMPPETLDEIEGAWIEEARRRGGQLERGEIESRDGDAALQGLETKLRGIHAK
jgi:hypothetical protein